MLWSTIWTRHQAAWFSKSVVRFYRSDNASSTSNFKMPWGMRIFPPSDVIKQNTESKRKRQIHGMNYY